MLFEGPDKDQHVFYNLGQLISENLGERADFVSPQSSDFA